MFKDVKLGYTVAIMPGIAAVGFVALIIVLLVMGTSNSDRLAQIQQRFVPLLETSRDLEVTLSRLQRGLQDAVAAADPEALSEVEDLAQSFQTRLDAYDTRATTGDAQAESRRVRQHFQEYYSLAFRVSKRMVDGEGGEDLVRSLEVMTRRFETLTKTLAEVTQGNRQAMEDAFAAAGQTVRNSTRWSILFAVLCLSALAVFSVYILRRLTSSLSEMTDSARSLAQGDLTIQALSTRGRSEIGQLSEALNAMADALRAQVGAIKQASGKVSGNAEEVMAATSQLASAASEQAAAIAETTSTVEEVKQTGQTARESAREIVEASERSVAVSSEGLNAVNASVVEIKRIREQAESIGAGIESLRGQVGKVNEIISTVDTLAEQSNLLAVNASIEAAKAGEFGRGFAVVAQEVKNLAEQSKRATAQVRTTLDNIQQAIEQVVTTARAGRERSEAGVTSIEHTGQVISGLSDIITQAVEGARQIAISANEQVVGLEQVAHAMTSVNLAASENLRNTQYLEKGGETLGMMARELEELVAHYRIVT